MVRKRVLGAAAAAGASLALMVAAGPASAVYYPSHHASCVGHDAILNPTQIATANDDIYVGYVGDLASSDYCHHKTS